jgi:SPW repeat
MKAALQTQLANHKLQAAGGALLLWVALAPFVWGYSASPAAVASHLFFLFAFGPLTLIILNLRPAAYVLTAAGIWLALSPWILGYATNHTAWLSDGVTGILFTILAAHAAGIRVSTPAHKRQQSAATPRVMETAGSGS